MTFPCYQGNKWHKISTTIFTYTQTVQNNGNWHLTVTGTALGWERDIGRLDGVMVDGLKLKIETQPDETIGDQEQNPCESRERPQEWYVPAARRSVLIRNQTDLLNKKNQTSRSVTTIRLVNFIPTN
ncbi:hypothetical protein [Thermomonas sp.]|uniref:hypothetical protein n=1 Tax=Thermomonas sp. TaxID=1971895 RepID=UPI002619D907|nr:hypothetical protein [Thermomonas sp.]MBL0228977.1 hypothetical protein [Thermomonas sp.]